MILPPQLWTEPAWRDVDAELAQQDPEERRRRAQAVAGLAVQRAEVSDDEVVSALSREKFNEQALSELEQRYDEEAFDAQDRGDQATYDAAFTRAQAVATVLMLSKPHADEALREAMYEARNAIDDDQALINAVLGRPMSPPPRAA